MTERLPRVVERLVPDITSDSDPPTVASFLRGLAIGALVGAAIAGSAVLQRRLQQGRDQAAAEPEEGPVAE
jgi:hypothetical protein